MRHFWAVLKHCEDTWISNRWSNMPNSRCFWLKWQGKNERMKNGFPSKYSCLCRDEHVLLHV